MNELNTIDFGKLHHDEVELEYSRVNPYLGQRMHYEMYRYCHEMALRLPDAMWFSGVFVAFRGGLVPFPVAHVSRAAPYRTGLSCI